MNCLYYMIRLMNSLPLDDIQGAFESLMKPSSQVQMVVRL